ncbi:RNAse R [Stanieria cyanosphaera PCC 7437]|uniref:exoribonuclease II n=1 Tax=Stanieria cyanosphaera (strain ATCC 29371 / PCC 7437) TaxID=111780 RepID=K9XP67_STAC7|nr:ribonuclease R family protein [Stanieria cyanosphaera]AFZ34405.1 RNAse R [Stanieria cyanosphaera PCC 7437]
MDFSIATILAQFVDDKLVAAKNLEKKLGCEDEESIQKLQIALDALEKIGILTKERGKYRRLYENDVVEAKLRCSSKGFCFAIQDEENADDIYVRESHLSNAWNGDRVLIKIIKEGSRRRSPEGEVKLILERANPSLLATVNAVDSSYRATPLDDRLLFELDLKQNGQDLAEAVEHLVHVSVLRYPIGQYPPLGKVTKILGSDAEEASDVDIVSCKHDLVQNFTESALKAASSLPTRIPAAEIKKRLDLRDKLTVAIEPETEEDNPWIENALTLEKTDNDNWQLGIHIADVAHYIEQDSPLDRAGKKRVTAINLRKKILPMLPEQVAKVCSLIPGKDRLTISVLIEINNQGEVVEYSIKPSVVKVDHKITYNQVQSLLGEKAEEDEKSAALGNLFNELFFNVSPLIKAQRLQRGGFEIATPEIYNLYKDEGRLGVILTSSTLPVRSLLTELMVLVGRLVAQHLQALQVPGIYCTQPEPDVDELEDLLKLGSNLQLRLDLDAEGDVTPQDYQALTQEFSKSPEAMVLNYILQGTFKPVKYSTKPAAHFGLAYSDGYTHCISPGQRYVDLLIQRILKTVFEYGRDRRHSRAKTGVDLFSSSSHGEINWNVLPPQMQEEMETELHAVIPHLNDREKLAEDAEKDLDGLKKAEKMKERTGKIFEGLITGVQSYGFFVEIEDLLVEGLVHVSSLKDDWYEYRSRHSCLVGRKNRIAYRLGDRVEVEVKSVDYYRQQIDLVTVGGGSTASNADLEEE